MSELPSYARLRVTFCIYLSMNVLYWDCKFTKPDRSSCKHVSSALLTIHEHGSHILLACLHFLWKTYSTAVKRNVPGSAQANLLTASVKMLSTITENNCILSFILLKQTRITMEVCETRHSREFKAEMCIFNYYQSICSNLSKQKCVIWAVTLSKMWHFLVV